MKTIAKWYPSDGEITYAKHGKDIQKEFEENPARVLTSPMAIETRRRTPELTDLGMQVYGEICNELMNTGCINLSLRWDRKCGCSCGCSPGYRIKTDVSTGEVLELHSSNGMLHPVEYSQR